MRMNRTARYGLAFAGVLVMAGVAMLNAADPPAAGAAMPAGAKMPTMSEGQPKELVGLHNVVAYHDGFWSGGVPEGEEGFATLADMGVKTIISVDGAEPEVELARKHGLRYIHLPIGYNGFNDQRKGELARATRDSMEAGPVYLHCHHGKHRSAGAAGAVAVSLGWATPQQMVDRMKVSGTAAGYKGLYACTQNATTLGKAALDAVPADFPEVSRPTSFVKSMVEIDIVNDQLKAIERAGWVTPKDHPDLVPAAEAGRLADLYRHLRNDDRAKRHEADYATMMIESHMAAQAIEDLLAADKIDAVKLSGHFRVIANSCKACHVKYRD